MRERLLRTAFLTALFSYLGFFLVDYLEPGLVSYVFSVHVWGLLALVLGIAWLAVTRRKPSNSSFWLFVALGLGLMLFWLFWREGEAFGSMRLLVALCAAVLPWFAWRALSARAN